MIIVRRILATGFAVISAGLAAAAPGDAFRELDKDQDGRISLEEFYVTGPPPLHPRMRQVFESFDPEHRGNLGAEEVAKVVDAVRSLQPKLDPAVDGTFADIPLQVHAKSKRAFVKARVNGVEGTFLVDTGTSDTIVDAGFARRAGIDFVEICMTITGGNYGKKGDVVSLVKLPQMEIGGIRFRDFHAVMRDESKKRSDFEGQLDGILGANLLFAKPLTLDYKNARLSFTEERSKPADFEFDLLPEYPKVPVVAAQLDGTDIRLMLDSGAVIGDTLLINEPYHEALRALAGDASAKDYQSKELRVSGKLLTSDKRCLLRPFEHSVIGAVFFASHRITVDRPAGKIRIWAEPE
ncbi:aspartyl protease family protein [Haloferula sp. BvORR071]|uniref:aspartyl protease family protein n=1 Tax=Haloferula sp. BvORR071 TaxID=1396141 RepID=UPI00055762FC|nr:aspartyl protease family protein [Haloferula sp. BvORR071]